MIHSHFICSHCTAGFIFVIISKQIRDLYVVFSNRTEQEKPSLTSKVTEFQKNDPSSSTSQTVHQQTTVLSKQAKSSLRCLEEVFDK